MMKSESSVYARMTHAEKEVANVLKELSKNKM